MEKIESIALLIDIENVSPDAIKPIIEDLSQRGRIAIKKVYCVADKLKEEAVKATISENNLDIKTLYKVVNSKNSSDINLVIDAMDILYNKDIDIFAIVSSDSDYISLVGKLKEDGKTVIGYGEKKAVNEYRNSFNDFIFVENLLNNKNVDLVSESQVMTIDQIEGEIKKIIESEEEGFILLSQLQSALKSKFPDFDQRTYGKKRFSDFIKTLPSIEVELLNDKSTYIARLKQDESKADEKAVTIEHEDYDISEDNSIDSLDKKVLGIINTKKNNQIQLSELKTELDALSFDYSIYGIKRFSDLIKSLPSIKVELLSDKSTYIAKPKAKENAKPKKAKGQKVKKASKPSQKRTNRKVQKKK